LPAITTARAHMIEANASMSTGHPAIFAGGDLIGGARTMTTAVGHGKKAARNINAFLRAEVYSKPEKHPIGPFEPLTLPVFLDAARQEASEVSVAKRTGFEEIAHGLT